MSPLPFSRLAVLLALAATLVAIAPLPARAQGEADPELKALGRYTLTLANLKKANAFLEEANRTGYKESDSPDDETMEQAVRRVEKDARARAILKKTGQSPRDLVMTLLAATSGHLFGQDPSTAPPELAAHIRFVKRHEAEVARLLKLSDAFNARQEKDGEE